MPTTQLDSTPAQLSEADLRERERLSREAYEQLFGPFDRGQFRELSEAEWQALIDGKRSSQHDPDSWALPPKGQAG